MPMPSNFGMISAVNISKETPTGTLAGIPVGTGVVIPTSTINETIDILMAGRR